MSRDAARRLFFALSPADTLRSGIAAMTRQVGAGRTIPAANFHITLAFLGVVLPEQVGAAHETLLAFKVVPFELTLRDVRWWRQQHLICLEPEPSSELDKLVAELHAALRARGFAIESRPFHAHATLMRDVFSEPAFSSIRELRWQVNEIELLESTPSTRGSAYTPLQKRA
jgi:RNA 2',3'-cyclic 3'-phosphodiesterase